jgi:rhodanese-related sulfurtransferase
MIIGVCGFISSGKDTVADYLVNFHEYRRESFANSLKDAVAQVFGWDRTMLEGRTTQAREWRECVDTWWAERLHMPNLTPRLMLQLWGTEVCRAGFHDDIWIASLENKLRTSQDNIVISDCRFPNEIKSLRAAGGIIVCIERGVQPHWSTIAARANQGDVKAQDWLKNEGIHASETAWVGTDFDFVLHNNSSIDSLYTQIQTVINQAPDRLAAKANQTS